MDLLYQSTHMHSGAANLVNTLNNISAISAGTTAQQPCQSRQFACSLISVSTVPDHDGGQPEEVNSCVLNSYMVYL